MEAPGDLVKNVVEIRETQKISDQRLSQLKDTVRMIDQNSIDRYNEIKEALKEIASKQSSSEMRLLELEEAMGRTEKELEKFAKLQDIKILDKYMSFIDPSRFLSRDDVIKIVDEYMSTKKWS